MELGEYQVLAIRTMADGEAHDHRAIVALGLNGEAKELYYAAPDKFVDEAGDVMWYIAVAAYLHEWSWSNSMMADFINLSALPGKFYPDINHLLGIRDAAADVAEHVKKETGHGHPHDATAMRQALSQAVVHLALECLRRKTSLNEVMERNIAKLRRRYPDGFSTRDSINRVDIGGE